MKALAKFIKFANSKLAFKFSFAIFLIIFTMGAGIFFIADKTIIESLAKAHRQKGEFIVSNLATNAVRPLLVEDTTQLQLLLRNTQESDKEIVYLFIMDSKGHVAAHTFPGGFPKDLKKIRYAFAGKAFRSQLLETGKGLILDIAAPILKGSLGSVHVGFSIDAIEGERRESQKQIFWICALASLIAVALSVLLSGFITRPMTALAKGANLFGTGNLDYRIEVLSDDEIGTTAMAFNQMAQSLQNDIVERKKAEMSLRESEDLYRTLVENIDMGIALVDENGTILKVNAAQGRLVRKEPCTLYGKKCYEEFEHRQQACPDCPGEVAMAKNLPSESIRRGKYPDGSDFTISVKAFPVKNEDGKIRRFIEVVEDISEKLKMQQDLVAEKERLAVTLRSIGDGVITTDISGKILMLNRVAEAFTGWENQEAQGRFLEEVFHIIDKKSREICENPVSKILSKGQIIELERNTVLISKDGTERCIADSGAPIFDSESRIIGVVLVFRDVTEQIRTEKELLKVKKMESVGVLAGGIAHDFNNILVAILGNINMALLESEMDEKAKDLLLEAEKASLRAKDLTQQLLTFAKGGEPVKETASLEGVIKDSAEFVLHGSNVNVLYDIPEDLWLSKIDKGQISQVIQNLVMNASQAMSEGGTVRIICENHSSLETNKFWSSKTNRYICIKILDEGKGIPASIIDRIFDPYFTTKHKGNGLGLAISQSIITKHDGHIAAESKPGSGSTFTICLPALDKVKPHANEDNSTSQKSFSTKILLMDDEIMIQEITGKMLEKMGHQVAISNDGEEAIKLYSQACRKGAPFDLVIMDLTIPGGMGGKDAVKEILKIDPDAKVIVSSGYSNDPIMANFKSFGFVSAIVKPYRFADLAQTVNLALEQVSTNA